MRKKKRSGERTSRQKGKKRQKEAKKKDKTERVAGLGRRTKEEMVQRNQ